MELRKKSPRAPTMALDDALERVQKAYEKERLHPAPTDVIAQHIGYKGANGGAALAALASLRYYGLLDRSKDGLLSVTKDVEAYRFAPSEDLKRSLRVSFLRRPPLFAELLDKYVAGLPSDATIKYELIQKGFLPGTAALVVAVFRKSVDFADLYVQIEASSGLQEPAELASAIGSESPGEDEASGPESPVVNVGTLNNRSSNTSISPLISDDQVHDQIPVRLPGGRRAWLCIPTPFYARDKERLKAQIDLLLADDE